MFRTYLELYTYKKKNAIYWLSPTFFEHLLVHYFRVGLAKQQVNIINSYALARIEQGLQHYFLDFGLILMERKFLHQKVFSDLNEFVNTYTVFNEITLSSLTLTFGGLLLSQLLVLVLFLGSKFYSTIKRYRRRFKRKIHFLWFVSS